MNQSNHYNIDNDNNLNIHKEETSIIYEEIVNKDNDKDDEDKNEYEQRYRDDNNDFVIDIYILGMLSLYLIVLFVLHYIFTHIA